MKSTKKYVFGICDDVDPDGNSSKPAYLDENNGGNWIATVENHHHESINFYAVDNCVVFPPRKGGKSSKRCDGMFTCGDAIVFVELKSSNEYGARWVSKADKQLRASIELFEKETVSLKYTNKRAYISNNLKPRSRISQAERMERFYDDTGYLLFIKARINIYNLEG